MNDNHNINKAYFEGIQEAALENQLLHIVLIVDVKDFEGESICFSESRWMDGYKNGWSYRVDAENTNTLTQRHIHIARTKHINSKNNQVAWNLDGSAHDKKNFNSSISKSSVTQKIARDVLTIPKNIELHEEQLHNFSMIFESIEYPEDVVTLIARKHN
jgi:hypothetical protein